MYHRNYTTYLQKELDFLKLLVIRFHEQENVNRLELDVALTKTQEIYEQLLRMKLVSGDEKKAATENTIDIPIVVPEKKIEVQPETTRKEQSPVAPQVPETPKSELVVIVPEPEIVVAPVEKAKPVPVLEETKQADSVPVRQDNKQLDEPAKVSILAEKITPTGIHPINETLAQNTVSDLSSKLQASPLTSIVSGIGLNDKFLYIRELFKGDNALNSNTVRHLDTADSLTDALDFIYQHFDWDKKNETTQKFINLVHRRHGKLSN